MALASGVSPLERLLVLLFPGLRRDRPGARGVRRGLKALSLLVGLSAVAYALGVLFLLVLFRVVGERWWLLWLPLYMPPQVVLLPLLGLVPAGLALCPRSLVVDALVVMVVVRGYMGLTWSWFTPEPAGPTLKVVTCNIGQRNSDRLTPFVEREAPDLIALQDASYRGGRYARQYADRHVQSHGQFILISRYPIRASGLVEDVLWDRRPVAAWFDIDWEGRPLRLYNVRLPTPRRELGRLMGIGLAKEWIRSRGWLGTDPADSIIPSLEGRPGLARALAERLRAETTPVIVAGDLNIPHWGYIYRQVTRDFWDAHQQRGRGFGFTFPGRTRNPLTLFGPWLRLDYLLCTRNFEVCEAGVEPRGRAQHRAVVARFGWSR